MSLGTEVGLGLGDFVLDGDSTPPQKKGTAPQFSAHVCCGQTAGWIKMSLNWYGGRPRPMVTVLDGDPAPSKKGTVPQFSDHVYCGQAVAHLSYC